MNKYSHGAHRSIVSTSDRMKIYFANVLFNRDAPAELKVQFFSKCRRTVDS